LRRTKLTPANAGAERTATEIGSNEPEVFEVKLDDDDPTTLSVKDRAGIVFVWFSLRSQSIIKL
jgi:hypothetical protein